MDLKEIARLVSEMASKGISMKCYNCGFTIKIKPTDVAAICIHCESSYNILPFVVSKLSEKDKDVPF